MVATIKASLEYTVYTYIFHITNDTYKLWYSQVLIMYNMHLISVYTKNR